MILTRSSQSLCSVFDYSLDVVLIVVKGNEDDAHGAIPCVRQMSLDVHASMAREENVSYFEYLPLLNNDAPVSYHNKNEYDHPTDIDSDDESHLFAQLQSVRKLLSFFTDRRETIE
jgi:hypothetical protein